jgi:hypothetical protein
MPLILTLLQSTGADWKQRMIYQDTKLVFKASILSVNPCIYHVITFRFLRMSACYTHDESVISTLWHHYAPVTAINKLTSCLCVPWRPWERKDDLLCSPKLFFDRARRQTNIIPEICKLYGLLCISRIVAVVIWMVSGYLRCCRCFNMQHCWPCWWIERQNVCITRHYFDTLCILCCNGVCSRLVMYSLYHYHAVWCVRCYQVIILDSLSCYWNCNSFTYLSKDRHQTTKALKAEHPIGDIAPTAYLHGNEPVFLW